ncbi:hypothetical protein [Achromobacter xylosoxidans]|uniref:hypothetical protein n=1 Tax=Alcaligenes xylosoxydans xylosoxydans TaxID=85698 RepID=UPI0006C09576|nr:hypothetical protein [Achromobacter xylosoxidans]CUK11811.1 Uncharacterised protein [Achromobacter xylosoxidans]
MMQQGEKARELLASGSKWTDEMARAVLPILLWAAKNHRTITYKQLAEELHRRTRDPIKRRMTLYGKPAGKVGTTVIRLSKETGWDIPPLNAIVVNAGTRLPGDGATYFIKQLLHPSLRQGIGKGDSDALAQAAVDAVLNYSGWDEVARALDVKRLPSVQALQKRAPKSEREPIRRPSQQPTAGGYPESPQHKALKCWAITNPKFFDRYGKFKVGRNEFRLESGDYLDAYLSSRKARLAIEVKASNAPESEIFRGIFQCIKYRATLRAMQLADGVLPNANAVLLLTRDAPTEARRLAKRLQVDILRAPAGADRPDISRRSVCGTRTLHQWEDGRPARIV